MRACCQYQIRDLEEGQPYWVRVSAFSGLEAGKPLGNSSASQSFGALGYGVARRTEPWSAVPAPQRPHKPTNVTFKLSTTGLVDERISPGEIPDQLDVAWRHPVLDHNTTLFDEVDGGQAIEAYVLEWDTDPYFHFGKPAGSYAARAITQGGDPLPCSLANCSFSLGAEVQVLRVYSGDGNALVAGSYALGSAGNSAEGPRTACVDFDATFGALEGELEGLLSAKVRVSREPITSPGPTRNRDHIHREFEELRLDQLGFERVIRRQAPQREQHLHVHNSAMCAASTTCVMRVKPSGLRVEG